MQPEIAPLLIPAFATAAAYILVLMGLRTRRLEPRHKHCRRCGRDTRICRCRSF